MKSSVIWIVIVIIILLILGGFFLVRDDRSSNTTFEYLNNSENSSDESEGDFSTSESLPKENPLEVKPPVVEEKITVSGTYTYSEDSKSSLSGKICFTPATSSGLSIFCISNKDEAYALFGIEKGFSDGSSKCAVKGSATIEIKSYQKLTGEVGGYDVATVTKVISSGEQSFSSCS